MCVCHILNSGYVSFEKCLCIYQSWTVVSSVLTVKRLIQNKMTSDFSDSSKSDFSKSILYADLSDAGRHCVSIAQSAQEGATGIQWVEAMDAAKHPTMHKTASAITLK